MTALVSCSKDIRGLSCSPKAKKLILFGLLNVISSSLLIAICNETNSMALTAFTYLTFFDVLMLISCFLSLWVERQSPTAIFSFGYERFEVLAVFASTILAQLGSLFIIKESIERILLLPEIKTTYFLMGLGIAFFCHVIITCCVNTKPWSVVISAASSSWLQEHVADISHSICHFIPGLSRLLLPRINPMMLIACIGGISLFTTHFLIQMNYRMADPLAAIGIAVMTCGTMFPMSVYSGKILLQTSPSHIHGQLDKCLREATTLDGVLEFQNEHFWTLSFGLLVGSLHVRIRRDANEQLVLAHLMDRLSNLISVLSVQVCKDDWSHSSTFQIFNNTSPFTSTSTSLPYIGERTFTKGSISRNSDVPRYVPSLNHIDAEQTTDNAINNSNVLNTNSMYTNYASKSNPQVVTVNLDCR